MRKLLLVLMLFLMMPVVLGSSSESPLLSEWFMHGRTLGRSSWDGSFFNASVDGIVFSDVSLPERAQQPVVSDGFLYVVDAEGVSRFNASNISQKIDSITGIGGAWGPDNGLVVTDYLYFVGGADYNTLYQVDKFNLSNVISSVKVNPDEGTITRRPCIPVVAEDYVFCNSGTSGAGVPQNMVYFARFNASFVEDVSSIVRTQFLSNGNIYATGFLAYSDGFIYGGVWDDNFVDEVYKIDVETMSVVDSFQAKMGIQSGLVVKDGFVYVPGADSTLYKRDVNNLNSGSSVVLSTDVDRTISTPAFYEDHIYVGVYPRQLRPEDGALYKLDMDLGVVENVSLPRGGGTGFRAPVVHAGFVYVTHSDGITFKLTANNFSLVEELSSLGGAFNWPGVVVTEDYYYGWYNSSSLFQTSKCDELWVPVVSVCYQNATQLLYYEDDNMCGTSYFVPEDDNTWLACTPTSSGGGGGSWPEDDVEDEVEDEFEPPMLSIVPPEDRFDLLVFFERLFSGKLFKDLGEGVNNFGFEITVVLMSFAVLTFVVYNNKNKRGGRK